MSQELIYTSAPQGIKPGSHGFCTVAYSRGMSANLIQQLESLSGYRHIYGPQDPNAALNPVAFSHLMFTVGGRRCHVLSRICDAGLDYSQRTNKFAHHIVLDAAEVPPGGPAALMARDGFMRTAWEGEPSILPTGPAVPSDESPPRVCRAWQQLTGDAGWAGVLAETATGAANRQVVLVYRPGTDMLALLAEALGLLPVNVRWRVSFSTYYTKLPAGIGCQWRCVVDGTPEATAARQSSQGTLVLDLCHPLGRAAGGIYVEVARTGKLPIAKVAAGKVAATQLGDKELERVLLESGELPVSPGVGARQPSEVNVGEYAVMRPLLAPPVCPPRPRPIRFQKKRRSQWPWVLGIAAVLLVFLACGLVLWTTLSGTPRFSLAVRKDTLTSQNGGKSSQQSPPMPATDRQGGNRSRLLKIGAA